MASRSLGTLTLDLIAKIGGFTAGMTEAERVADKKSREIAKKQAQRAKEVRETWEQVGNAIGTVFAGLTVGAVFQKFITETRNAEQEQAQLNAALKSTAEGAGYGADQLNDMADAMAKASTFGGGDINQAQTRLLSYTGVVGEQFPRALQAAIDMATRLGMDVPAAAEAVGKALDSPKDGLAALSKQGFRFTEDQKALVEELQKTGKTAEAQGLILTALESSYGGAAAAARDTFGGALSALQESVNDLLTGDGRSMRDMRTSVENLTRTLSSEETKAAFQVFTGWMAGIANTTARTLTAITELSRADFSSLLISGDELSSPIAALRKTEEQIAKLKKTASEIDPKNSMAMRLNDTIFGDFATVNRQITLMEQKAASLRRNLGLTGGAAGGGRGGVNPANAAPASAPDATGAAARAKAAEEAEKAREAAAKKRIADEKSAREAAANFIQTLRDQIGKTQELTVAEDLLRQVREGKVKLTDSELDRAIALATVADVAKDAAESEKRRNEQMKEGYDLARSLMTPMEQLGDLQERLQGLLDVGAITWQTYDRALVAGLNSYAEQVPGVKAALSQIDEFTLQAARNVQDALGAGVKSALKGDFESIGSLWRNTVQDMVAQAAAAKLNSYLFGNFGKTINGTTVTQIGGVAGGALDWLGSLFDGGGFTGPGGKYEPAGIVHAGEYVINAEATSRIGLGALNRLNGFADGGYVGSLPGVSSGAMDAQGGITFAPVTHVQVDARSDQAAVFRGVNQMLEQNNRAYTEFLQRQKVLAE